MNLISLTEAVANGREIAPPQAIDVARTLADPDVAATDKETFLETLSERGARPVEIAAFARAFRDMARNPGLDRWAPAAIDVCGTGGDRSGTFNISTAVGFALAAAGIPVFKHGNRSVTSKCGSADLLEALGISITPDADTVVRSVEKLNFVFLFAPNYHPAFKEIIPVRRALGARGVRTIFNILGPLLNPAAPAHQIVGVYAEEMVVPVARALDSLGLAGGMAVHSVDEDGRGYDELTTVGRNIAAGFGRQRDVNREFTVDEFGWLTGSPAGLAGGDVATNVELLHAILAGAGPKSLVDSIVLNTAAGLHAVGRSGSIMAALEPARDLLLGGTVKAWLAKAQKFYRG